MKNFTRMKFNSGLAVSQAIYISQVTSLKRLFEIFTALLLTFLLLNGCQKETTYEEQKGVMSLSQQGVNEIDNCINSFYKSKRDLALNFEGRDKIVLKDVFVSEEVEQAVRYQFLFLAEMGMIKEYSQDITILHDEVITLPNGNLLVPALEKVASTSIPPNSAERIESSYTDKLFFTFSKIDDHWKIDRIELLLPNFSIESKYSPDEIVNFSISDAEVELRSGLNLEAKVQLEERKIFGQFFDKKINNQLFGEKLNSLYEGNILLHSLNENKSQGLLNKNNVVKYALKWTDNSDSNQSTYYNNSMYKSLAPTDCANFCSQCLKAGGWSNESPFSNWNLWWYNDNKTTKTSDDSGSSAWVGANALFNYIVPSKASLKSVAQAHAGSIGIADLIWIPAKGPKTHVMITTQVAGICLTKNIYYYYIYYSAHTRNRKNCNLGSYENVVFGHFQ